MYNAKFHNVLPDYRALGTPVGVSKGSM